MQVRIHKRAVEDVAVLVEWRCLEPLWLRSTFAPVDRSKLVNAYSDLWFDKKSDLPWGFTLGEIEFHQNKLGGWELQFRNGRNRTNLLIKHQSSIPVCVIGAIPDDADIQAAIVKLLNEGDVVDIPDLPIYPASKLRVVSEGLRFQSE